MQKGTAAEVAGWFSTSGDPDWPLDRQFLVARYDQECYEGSAFVLFRKDGKLYEVHGSHCSCYGLEGQWAPEETDWKALAMRSAAWYWSDLVEVLPQRYRPA